MRNKGLKRPSIGHLAIYGYRAYPLIQNRLKLDKIQPRVEIRYLVSFKFINIFKIQVLERNIVIKTRDITFNKSKFYNLIYKNKVIKKLIIQPLVFILIPKLKTFIKVNKLENRLTIK